MGDTGNVSAFSDGVNIMCHVPHLFLFRFFSWRGFKNRSDVCRVLCEEHFIFDVTHSQVDLNTEFGVVIFFNLASVK